LRAGLGSAKAARIAERQVQTGVETSVFWLTQTKNALIGILCRDLDQKK
jgi:hypothetical protein